MHYQIETIDDSNKFEMQTLAKYRIDYVGINGQK